MNNEFLDTNQAATITRFTKKSLERMRVTGEGPPFYKLGKVFYTRADLEAWLATRRYTRTKSEPDHNTQEEPEL